jgi:hypothetical protein
MHTTSFHYKVSYLLTSSLIVYKKELSDKTSDNKDAMYKI